MKSLGVNRYTIGVQSFDEEVLRKANRFNSVQDIYQTYYDVRKAGIQNINFDILLGLVGETWDSYTRTLKGIVDLRPDCVSFMTMDLGHGVNENYGNQAKKSYFFQESLKSKIFSYVGYVLEKIGYEKAAGFSDSTFVLKDKRESINRHLLNRFKLHPVLGIGSVAYSSLDLFRYTILSHEQEYSKLLKKNSLPQFIGIELNSDELIRSYFIYNFVLWGKINKKEFHNKFGKKIEQVINEKFVNLKKDNMIFDAGEDFIFLPSSETMRGVSRYSGKNYGNQERYFLFCLKYFYSKIIIDQCKILLKQKFI